MNKYIEYELRKKEIQAMNLSWKEYEIAITRLAKELGI